MYEMAVSHSIVTCSKCGTVYDGIHYVAAIEADLHARIIGHSVTIKMTGKPIQNESLDT